MISFIMYNQSSRFLLDLYRSYFGFIASRERVDGRKDAFFELHVNDENQADQQTLRRLSASVSKISELCFKECVSLKYKLFTYEQSSCISSCTQNYLNGYQNITRYTLKKLTQ